MDALTVGGRAGRYAAVGVAHDDDLSALIKEWLHEVENQLFIRFPSHSVTIRPDFEDA